MNERLVEHLLEPSTLRGICWIVGALVSLAWIHDGDMTGALAVLSQTALAAGSVGVLTKEKKTNEQ